MKIYFIFHCNNVIALFPLVFDYTYKHGNQHKHEHDFTTLWDHYSKIIVIAIFTGYFNDGGLLQSI